VLTETTVKQSAQAIRLLIAGMFVSILIAGTQFVAYAAKYDLVADRVLGQPNFTDNPVNNGALPANAHLNQPRGISIVGSGQSKGRLYLADSQNSRVLSWPDAISFVNGQTADIMIDTDGVSLTLNIPSFMVVDGLGNLFVADTNNNRVLKYSSPITNGAIASVVLGQPTFNDSAPNNPIVGARTLNGPFNVAVDANNNLYVADTLNSRILKYNAPINTSYVSATVVIGQPNFTSNAPNSGGVSASSLNDPFGVTLDNFGNLYVSDTQNNRVLQFTGSITSSMSATKVIGQSNFASTTGGTSSTKISFPYGLVTDSFRNLFVADVTNNRVLQFNASISTGMAASRVFGQPDFSLNTANYSFASPPECNLGTGNPSACNLWFPYGVAIDKNQNLYIVENSNNRALGFDQPTRNYFLPLIYR